MTSRLLEDLILKKKATSVIVPMGGWEMAVTKENLQEAVKFLRGRDEKGADVRRDHSPV